MERKTRIKAVAVALTAVFLASIALASLAFGASSNAAGTGTYQTFSLSKAYGYGPWIDLTTANSYRTLLSISLPYVGIEGWYDVVCDGYANAYGNREFAICITKDGLTEDTSTRRYYQSAGGTSYHLTGIHTERMYYLGPGAHTFYFRATPRGTGSSVVFNYMTIKVTFYTDAYVSQMHAGEVAGSADGTG